MMEYRVGCEHARSDAYANLQDAVSLAQEWSNELGHPHEIKFVDGDGYAVVVAIIWPDGGKHE